MDGFGGSVGVWFSGSETWEHVQLKRGTIMFDLNCKLAGADGFAACFPNLLSSSVSLSLPPSPRFSSSLSSNFSTTVMLIFSRVVGPVPLCDTCVLALCDRVVWYSSFFGGGAHDGMTA